jgi:hypothetical protein
MARRRLAMAQAISRRANSGLSYGVVEACNHCKRAWLAALKGSLRSRKLTHTLASALPPRK